MAYTKHMDFRQSTDEELFHHAQKGASEAFDVVVERYWPKLLRYVQRLLSHSSDAEDIVQNSFLKAYTNIASFRSGSRVSPWLYRITHNTLVDHVKTLKRAPLPFFDPDVLFPHPVAPERPDRDADEAAVRVVLEKHLQNLDARYREPLVLRYYEGLSYRDIADVLHLPVGTVSVRIQRGLKQLRALVPHDIL